MTIRAPGELTIISCGDEGCVSMDVFLIVTRTANCEAEVDNVGEKKLPQFLRSCYSAQHPGQDIESGGYRDKDFFKYCFIR